MADLYYSTPAAVITEAALTPEEVNEPSEEELIERVTKWLVGIKGLIDAYTQRNFHEEFGKDDGAGGMDYSDIPPTIHMIAERAGANAAAVAKMRGGPATATENEYQVYMYRDEILSPSIRRELDLFVKPVSSVSGGLKISRVRSSWEMQEAATTESPFVEGA